MDIARFFIPIIAGKKANPLNNLLANFPGGDEVIFTYNNTSGTTITYFCHQHIGDNTYWRVRLLGDSAVGGVAFQIDYASVCDYYSLSTLTTNPALTKSGTAVSDLAVGRLTGKWIQMEGTNSYLQLVTGDNCTIVGAAMGGGLTTSAAMCKVTIDGDATLADLLPTAQELVDASALTSAALVANGGSLNPTDRIMDTYNLTNNYIGPGIASIVFFSNSLAPASHTVRVTETAYYHVGSSGGFVRMPGIFAGGANYARANSELTVPMFVLKQNMMTVMGTPEISWNNKPEGASAYEWVGHTGSLKTKSAPVVNVDGAEITPANNTFSIGSVVEIVTQDNVRHSEAGATNLGVLDMTFRFSASEGMTISHSLAWAVNGVAVGYPCMLPVDHAVFDRYNTLGSGLAGGDLTDNDNAVNFNTTKQAAYCWDSDGYQAAIMQIPNLTITVENWAKTTTEQLWWADVAASEGTWKKAYATRFKTDEAYTNIAAWSSEANYRVAWIPAGADAVFAALT